LNGKATLEINIRILKPFISLIAIMVITSCANTTVIKPQAKAAVNTYYNYLRVGLSREEQNHYWTVKRAKRFTEMVYRISSTTGVEQSVEARRIMDVATFHARCEEMVFMDSDTSGYFVKKATLLYRVNQTCAGWVNVSQRQVDLKYSKINDQWLIDQVYSDIW